MSPPALPETKEAVVALKGQLQAFAEACVQNPTERGTILRLGQRYADLKDPFPDFDMNEIHRDALPELQLRTPRVPALDEGRTELRLTRRIRTGQYRGYSQVYGARFVPERAGDKEVVIKIYQNSYSLGFKTALEDEDPKSWTFQLCAYQHEAWAYFKLQDLQGSIIPYIHGFFEVTLPHGEGAFALVLECVQGTSNLPLDDGYQTSAQSLNHLMDRLVPSVQNLVARGILSELKPRHILWPKSSTQGTLTYPIIIDFGHILEPDLHHRQLILNGTLRLLKGYRFTPQIAVDWIERNIDPKSRICQAFDLEEAMMKASKETWIDLVLKSAANEERIIEEIPDETEPDVETSA